MKITFYGHSTIGIKIGESFLLADPYITANPKAAHIDIDSLKPDIILLTHAHSDHTLDVEYIPKVTKATIISNFEITNQYQAKGLNVLSMNIGGNHKFDFGTIKYVNALQFITANG